MARCREWTVSITDDLPLKVYQQILSAPLINTRFTSRDLALIINPERGAWLKALGAAPHVEAWVVGRSMQITFKYVFYDQEMATLFRLFWQNC